MLTILITSKYESLRGSALFSYHQFIYRRIAPVLLCIINLLTATAQSPVIHSFFPAAGGEWTAVNISGRNFNTASQVSFGGTAAHIFYITSDTTITAFVGNGSSGAVSVTNNSGTASLPGFIFVPPPVINSINPQSGITGDTITIKGRYFINVYDVFFGDSAARSFIVLSDSVIKAVVGNGTSGVLTVSTVGGQGSITGFTYNGPVITYFSPTAGGAGTVVKIRGNHFTGATAISFGGFSAASFTVNADTLITAVVGAGGPGNVIVVTPTGVASAAGFIVPYIKDFSPQAGTRFTEVTITGLNFTGTTAVYFGDSSALSFSVISDTVIKAIVGYGMSGAISISNNIYTAAKDYFFYTDYQPSIFSFTPSTGIQGTVVTIRGSQFTGTSTVQFGNTAAASFTVVSDSVITAVVGNGSSGYIYVTNNNYTDSLAGFNFLNQQRLQLCPPVASTSLGSGATGTAYQWQVSTNNGSNFSNINNSINYSGVTSSTLQLINIPSSFYGYIYRCLVNGTAANQYKITFVNTWIGAVNTLWNNTGNWSCNALPDANTDVIINTGMVNVNVNAFCRSLQATAAATVLVNSSFTLTVTK